MAQPGQPKQKRVSSPLLGGAGDKAEVDVEEAGLGQTTPLQVPPPLQPLSAPSQVRLALLLALNDAVGDLDETYLFFLIPISSYGCGGIDHVFGSFLVVQQVGSLLCKLLLGWVLDTLQAHQRWFVALSSLASLLTMMVVCVWGQDMGVVGLSSVYVAHILMLLINEISIWKLTKHQVQESMGRDNAEGQSELLKRIGSWELIVGNSYEVVVLLLAWVYAKQTQSFEGTRVVMVLSVLGADLVILLLSLTLFLPRWGFWREQKYHPLHHPQLQPPPAEGDELTFGSLAFEGAYEDSEESDSGSHPPAPRSTIRHWLQGVGRGVAQVARAVWQYQLAAHGIAIAWLYYTFTEVAEYPVAFAEAHAGNDDPESGTPENFCNGTVQNLLFNSGTNEIADVLISVLFLAAFTRMSAPFFYLWAQPVTSAIVAVLLLLLYFGTLLPMWLALAIVSVCVVAPDHLLEKYNFYSWAAAVPSRWFASVYVVYDIGKNALHLLSALLLSLPSEEMTPTDPAFSLVILLCLGLLAGATVYSILVGILYRKQLAHGGGGGGA